MQTFMVADPHTTAMILDSKRLNKQIQECFQMITAEENESDFYKNHPCRIMWHGYVDALKLYYNTMLFFWKSEGRNSNRDYFKLNVDIEDESIYPWWYNDTETFIKICKSHRKALLIKDFEYYSQYFTKEIDEKVIVGSLLEGYYRVPKSGKNKGKNVWVKPSEAKAKFIKENNIYFWAV